MHGVRWAFSFASSPVSWHCISSSSTTKFTLPPPTTLIIITFLLKTRRSSVLWVSSNIPKQSPVFSFHFVVLTIDIIGSAIKNFTGRNNNECAALLLKLIMMTLMMIIIMTMVFFSLHHSANHAMMIMRPMPFAILKKVNIPTREERCVRERERRGVPFLIFL